MLSNPYPLDVALDPTRICLVSFCHFSKSIEWRVLQRNPREAARSFSHFPNWSRRVRAVRVPRGRHRCWRKTPFSAARAGWLLSATRGLVRGFAFCLSSLPATGPGRKGWESPPEEGTVQQGWLQYAGCHSIALPRTHAADRERCYVVDEGKERIYKWSLMNYSIM